MLTLLALAGFVSARARIAANHILSDVSLAHAEASPETRQSNRLYEISFTTDSHLPIHTVRTESFSAKWADLVIVEDVPERVCRILLGMNGVNGLTLLTEANETYVPFKGCETGVNRMIFSLNGEGSCDCPAHASCELDMGCYCDFGYELSSDGSCREMTCPSVWDITAITEEYCCGKANGLWDGIVGCACPEDTYFNGTSCVPSRGFCVYSYEDPIGGGYYSNCSYTYAEPSGGGYYSNCSYTFSETDGVASVVSRESCPSGQYCILKWTDTDCSSEIGSSSASVIYGRCAAFTTHYSECRQYEENIVPNLSKRESCPSGQYCILKWTDTDCSDEIGSSGASVIYGRCAAFTTHYSECRQYEENIVPTLLERQGCGSGEYCRLTWSSNTCDTLSTEGAALIYGVCLAVTQSSPMTCPVENEKGE